MRDFFIYIKDTIAEIEEEIDDAAGDSEYTEEQAELLGLVGEIDLLASEALKLL